MSEHPCNTTPSIVPKYCVFCARPLAKSTSTREHAVPQWLLRLLKIENTSIQPAGWRSGQSYSRNPHPWLQLVVRAVCATCNSGWLSDLENAVKPLLRDLVVAQDCALATLGREEQTVLARWTTKTLFLIHRTTGIPTIIPPAAYRSLYDAPTQLPSGTHVFAFQDDGEHPVAINGMQSQDWTVHAPYRDLCDVRATLRNTCKVSIRINRLHLLVAYLGDTGFEPVRWDRVHLPVFPTQCRLWINAGLRVSQITPRQESSAVLFHVSLGIARNCSQDQLDRKSPPCIEVLHERFFIENSFLNCEAKD